MRAYARIPSPNESVRDRRVIENVEVARRIALRVARRVPPWLSQDDLVAAAMIGLTEAADRYDESRGEPFVAFAEKRIRGAVLDELRRGDLLSRRNRVTASRIGTTMRQLEHALGRPPEDAEIAKALSVTIEDYRENLSMLTQVSFVDVGETVEPLRAFEPQPEEATAQKEILTQLRAALEELPERDAKLLSLYYIEELGYAEIGEIFGVSESRVCQLHGRALARLRQIMSANNDEEE